MATQPPRPGFGGSPDRRGRKELERSEASTLKGTMKPEKGYETIN